MNLRIRSLIAGLLTYIPGSGRVLPSHVVGGAVDPRYCYSVWLRYLVRSKAQGLPVDPVTVAELGPGDSLGIGLAALIAGASTYCAFDVARHANSEKNLAAFDELVRMFQTRQPIPDETAFPQVRPSLESYQFPEDILSETRLRKALAPDRLARIRSAITHGDESLIRYVVPWNSASILSSASVDLIFSQAVLEHVEDLEGAYSTMLRWLKPGGVMLHTIDFRSHGLAWRWNGHWQYSDLTWGLIRGKRDFLINREPFSAHMRLMTLQGFDIAGVSQYTMPSECTRKELPGRFRNMSDEDLTTCTAFIQAVKPVGQHPDK